MKAITGMAIVMTVLCVAVTTDSPAQTVIRYDAGVGSGPPPVAPDQFSFNGRTWTATLNTNADVTVGRVSSDLSYCVNAWNVTDKSVGAGLGVCYSFPFDAPARASAASNGWELTVVSRNVTNHSGTATAFVQVGDTNTGHRFFATIHGFASGTLAVTLLGTNGGTFGFAQATNYHTHKLVYSPATGKVNYYVDWQLIKSGWTGDDNPGTIDGPAFGTSSDSGKGSINFHRVEFGVQPPGPVATAIHYIQVGPYAERTALQWNAASNPGGPAIKEYVVYRNGLEVQRDPATTLVDVFLLPCHEYEFTVVAVDTNGTAYNGSLPFPVTSLPTVPVTGVRTVKVLLYNFPDFPGEPFTTNAANDLMFSNAWSLKAYFLENSYGKLTWQGDTDGWYTMPQSISNYCLFNTNFGTWNDCDNNDLIADALNVLPPDQTNNLGTYDNYVMVFQGVGTVGKAAGFYKLISADAFELSVILHEMGHLLDKRSTAVMHAAGWTVCSTYPVGPDLYHPNTHCFVGRYTDGYDPMGAGNSYHLSMYHKQIFGFLEPSNIQTADQDGDYVLYAAEMPTNGVQMLKIPLEHDELFYFLEYRKAQGFDGPGTPQQGSSPIDGVLIRLRVALVPGTDADTVRPAIVLNPGTPFLDPYRGLRVEVTQKIGDHAVVRVTGTGKPLKVTDTRLTGAGNQDVQLTFDSVQGAKYFIQSSSNLFSWGLEQTNVVAGSASTTNALPGAGGAAQKMFRVGVGL